MNDNASASAAKSDSRRLIGLALIVTLKLLIFGLLGRTETIHFIYAGF